MPTDLYKDVLFSDGEGADTADLNNLRGYMGARVYDQLMRAAVGNARGGGIAQDPDHRTTVSAAPFLYALVGGAGYIVPGGGALQTTVRGGTIFQQVGSPSGNEPSFLPYTMVDGEFTLTHAAGDATNPRLDIIEVKLELVSGDSESRIVQDPLPSVLQSVQTVNKKRRIQATFQIVQGTPAATPAYPTLTAGFTALGAVRVPALHAGVHARTDLRDLRLPIGVKMVEVGATQMAYGGVGVALDQSNISIPYIAIPQSTFGSVTLTFPISATARLVGVGVFGLFNAATSTDAHLGRLRLPDVVTSEFPLVNPVVSPRADVASTLGIDVPDASWRYVFIGMDSLESLIASGSIAESRNAAGIGAGLWGDGTSQGPISEALAVDPSPMVRITKLGMRFSFTTGVGDDCAIAFVRCYYADGLA